MFQRQSRSCPWSTVIAAKIGKLCCAATTKKGLLVEAMLYQLYDWQRAALEPFRLFAKAGNEIYGHPDSPLSYLPGSRNVAAAFDLMTRLTQRYERPEFGIEKVVVG